MDIQSINYEMEKYIQTNEMAGAALIVRRYGDEVYRNKWGYADIEKKQQVEYDTIYRLASMTKPITSVAIMQLVEQGKMRLDDSISEYLRGFDKPRVFALELMEDGKYKSDSSYPAGLSIAELLKIMKYIPARRQVTIRDLLSHSSGMGMGPLGLEFASKLIDKNDNLERRVNRWSKLPLDFQPGTKTGYSAIVGFDILGRIVEVVSGLNYQDYLRKKIFEPLGIKDISFQLTNEQLARRAKLYCSEDGKHVLVQEGDELWKEINPEIAGYYSGAAGLSGSIEDYDKFTTMLANRGAFNGVRILNKETVASIQNRGAKKQLNSSPGSYWGLGMRVFAQPELDNLKVAPGTYGWSGAYGTHMFIHPGTGISATFVMNRTNIGGASSPIARKVEELVFGIF